MAQKKLQELGGSKIIAFVTGNCPVSMVETILWARCLSQEKSGEIVIASTGQYILQRLYN